MITCVHTILPCCFILPSVKRKWYSWLRLNLYQLQCALVSIGQPIEKFRFHFGEQSCDMQQQRLKNKTHIIKSTQTRVTITSRTLQNKHILQRNIILTQASKHSIHIKMYTFFKHRKWKCKMLFYHLLSPSLPLTLNQHPQLPFNLFCIHFFNGIFCCCAT